MGRHSHARASTDSAAADEAYARALQQQLDAQAAAGSQQLLGSQLHGLHAPPPLAASPGFFQPLAGGGVLAEHPCLLFDGHRA